MYRKRKGGIQLEGEDDNAATSDTNEGEQASEVNFAALDKEEAERKKEEQEEKRKASLWSNFLKDVGQPVKKPAISKVGAGSSSGKPAAAVASSKVRL